MADRFMKQQMERKRRNKSATNAGTRNNPNTRKSSKSKLLDQFVHQFTNQSSPDTDDSESQSTNPAMSSQSRPKRRRRTRSTRNITRKSGAGKENQSSSRSAAKRVDDGDGTKDDDVIVVAQKEAHKPRVTMATGHPDYMKTIKAVTEMKAAAPLKTFGQTTSRLSVKFRGMFRDSKKSSVARRRDPLKSTESSESDLVPDFQPSRRQSDVLSVLLKSGDRSRSLRESSTEVLGESSRSVDRLRSRYRTPSSVDASPWRTPQSTTGAKYNSHSVPPDMRTVQFEMKASLVKDVSSLVTPGYYDEILSRVKSLAVASYRDRTPEPKRRGIMSGDVATRRRLEELFTDDVPNSVKRESHNVDGTSKQRFAASSVPPVVRNAEDDLFVVKPVLDEVAECCDNPFVSSRQSTSPLDQGMEWLMDVDSNPFASQESFPTSARDSQESVSMYRQETGGSNLSSGDFGEGRGERYRPAYDPYHEQLKNGGGLDFLDHISYEPCQCYKCLAVTGSTYGHSTTYPPLPVDHRCNRQLTQHSSSNGLLLMPRHSGRDTMPRRDGMTCREGDHQLVVNTVHREPLRDISFSASENSNTGTYHHSNVRYQRGHHVVNDNRQHNFGAASDSSCRSKSEFRRPLPVAVMHDIMNGDHETTPATSTSLRGDSHFMTMNNAPVSRSTVVHYRMQDPSSASSQMSTSSHQYPRQIPSDFQRCEHYRKPTIAQYRIDSTPVEEQRTRPEFLSPIF